MFYPEDFKARVLGTYPNNTFIREALKNGEAKSVRDFLRDNSTDPDSYALYEEWNDIRKVESPTWLWAE